nr:hypothetical protein [Tanacetum cinerariifolium]
ERCPSRGCRRPYCSRCCRSLRFEGQQLRAFLWRPASCPRASSARCRGWWHPWPGFAEAEQAHGPAAGLGQGVLKLAADAHFRDFAAPALAPRAALVAKTPDVVALFAVHVAEARHVNAVGPPPIHDFGDDGKRPQRELARSHSRWQRSRLRAEIRPKWAPQPALVAVLAVDAVVVRLRDVGRAANDHVPVFVVLF